MALEDLTGTKYIDSLNSSNPTATDGVSEGDDHLRGIKNVLKLSFPAVSGAVTSTHTELNILDGVTATTAEINTLDGTVTAVTNYESGMMAHIFDDSNTSNSFLITGNITESTWESVGGVGSGATNESAAFSDVPTAAKAVILTVDWAVQPSTTTSTVSIDVWARKNGSAVSPALKNALVREDWYAGGSTATRRGIARDVIVPASSGIFDIQWTVTGDASTTLILYLRGFVT